MLEFNPPKMEAVVLADLPEPLQVTLRLEKPDGSPAVGALFVALEPSLVSATVDRNGIANFTLFKEGPIEFMGWLPGHKVLRVSKWDPNQGQSIRFQARAGAPLGPLPELKERKISFQLLQTSNQEPIPGALVLGLDSQGGPPWVTLSDSRGNAVLKGVTEQLQEIKVYAPGLPPQDAWLLGSTTPESLAKSWALNTRTIVIEDGKPGEVLRLRKVPGGELLPLKLFPELGHLSWGPLPDATYERVEPTSLTPLQIPTVPK
jgi:hypothetical protein